MRMNTLCASRRKLGRIHRATVFALLGAVGFMWLSAHPRHAQADTLFPCQPTEVWDLRSMPLPEIQIGCSNNFGGISWFGFATLTATPTAAELGTMNRLVSLATSALLSGKKLKVMVSSTNCQGDSTCRIISSWGLSTP